MYKGNVREEEPVTPDKKKKRVKKGPNSQKVDLKKGESRMLAHDIVEKINEIL